jgi:two-component system sensor histidine kinase/response regulator
MPLVITSIEGVIEFVNPVFTSLTGYDKSEVIGQNARIMASGQLKISHYRKLWDTILAGKTWKGEFINKKKNGEIYWELASISPILNDSGEILNFVKICEDITHIKKLEKDLKEAKDKAEAANIHKNNFLANISHEIRTPMNGITGFAELLKKPNLNAEMKNKYVNIINNSSQTLLNLIDDIIDISKIEAGEIRLNKKEVHIRELLIDLHTLYNRIKHERKRPRTEIRLNMPPLDHSPVILTDQHRLRQILNNLINNALKFTENGSVEFGYNIRNDKLEFFIKDTGIGIQEGKQDLIFTRFRQVDENIARKYGGTGLGLAISKGLVELLDGKIWLKSKPGKGTTFYFTIPYISANHIEEEVIKPSSISESQLEGRTALVVEDDDVNFEFLLAVLEDEGMTITRASDGVEAVEIYTENPGFDFVLMDINLPRKNGLEASREIMAENHNQIIIAQTAYAMQEEIEKCLQSGCIDYVTKPIKPKILVNKLLKYS